MSWRGWLAMPQVIVTGPLHTPANAKAFSPGGPFQHLSWESFVDMEMENKLRPSWRTAQGQEGGRPIEDKKLTLSPRDEDFPDVKVADDLVLA